MSCRFPWAVDDFWEKVNLVPAVRDLIHLRDRKMIDRLTALEILEARFLKPIRSNPAKYTSKITRLWKV